MSPLDGRTILLTGALGGLGRAMSAALLDAGANLVAIDLAPTASEHLAGQSRLLYVSGNIAEPATAGRAVEAALAKFGAIHALINNAGLGMDFINRDFATNPTRFWELDPAMWRRAIDVNTTAPFLMARAVTPHFLAQGEGRIVNVTTSYATMLLPGFSPYGPSKAALEAATLIWSRDLAGSGVTVNALLPGGAADTPMISDRAFFASRGVTLVRPEVMGPPAVWLCSAASSAATGRRFVANNWDAARDPSEAAASAGAPAAW